MIGRTTIDDLLNWNEDLKPKHFGEVNDFNNGAYSRRNSSMVNSNDLSLVWDDRTNSSVPKRDQCQNMNSEINSGHDRRTEYYLSKNSDNSTLLPGEFHSNKIWNNLDTKNDEIGKDISHWGVRARADRVEQFLSITNTGHSKLDQWRWGEQSASWSENTHFQGSGHSSFGDFHSGPWSNKSGDTATDTGWLTMCTNRGKSEYQTVATEEYDEIIDDPIVNSMVEAVTEDTSSDGKYTYRTSISEGGENSGRESISTTASFSNALDVNVPEFVPGQPWFWLDPKDMAANWDTTPANVTSSKSAWPTSVVGNTGVNPGSNPRASMTSGYANSLSTGYLNSLTGQVLFTRPALANPTTLTILTSAGACRLSPPFSHALPVFLPSVSRVQYRTPMKISATAAVSSPYTFLSFSLIRSRPWAVLSSSNMIEEHALQNILSRIGPLNSCILPPGAGLAVVRFQDGILEKVLARLNIEMTALGIYVQLAKEEEVIMLLKSLSGHT